MLFRQCRNYEEDGCLGQFEQLVLTTVLLCGEKAYGMAVHEKVEELGERRVNSYSTFVPHPVSSTNLWDPALHEVRSKDHRVAEAKVAQRRVETVGDWKNC